MAHYDLEEDKINGCEKNTAVWWHEKGHKVFNNHKIGSNINVMQHYMIFLLLFALVFELKTISVTSLIWICLIELAGEIHAWIYAFMNKDKWRKNE